MSVSPIEWTEHTWNPVRGCSRISPGCINCYAERMAARNLPEMKSPTSGEPFAIMTPSGPRWSGKVELIPHMLDVPLRRRIPTTYFVNSMSDLFHEDLPDEAIDRVFAVMALCPQHTFQVLTKRAKRMREWGEAINRRRRGFWHEHGGYLHNLAVETGVVTEVEASTRVRQAVRRWRPDLPLVPESIGDSSLYSVPWPIPNVHLGVSVEDQQRADERIPELLRTPAAVRFLSVEPLLGPVDLERLPSASGIGRYLNSLNNAGVDPGALIPSRIDWVIVGGESGPGARPMHPDWVRSIRDQCVAAGVAFFFKQWGSWRDRRAGDGDKGRMIRLTLGGRNGQNLANAEDGGDVWMQRVGKKKSGRLLDGREWNEMPTAQADRSSGCSSAISLDCSKKEVSHV